MNTKIKRIGNSRGVVIPASILKMFGIEEGDEMDIRIENNDILLTKRTEFNPPSLTALFENYPDSYHSEIIFDDAKGKEIW